MRANLAGPSCFTKFFGLSGTEFIHSYKDLLLLTSISSTFFRFYTMNKIMPILLLLVAVLASAVMANEENSRPGGFYLRGEEEQDLIREVRAHCIHALIVCCDVWTSAFSPIPFTLVYCPGAGGRRRVLVASTGICVVLHVNVDLDWIG